MNKQLNTKGKGGGQAQVGPSWLPVPIRLRQPHPYQSFLILPPNHVHAGFSSWVQATTGIWVTPYSHSSPFIPVPPFLTRVHTAPNSTPLSLPGAWRSQESRASPLSNPRPIPSSQVSREGGEWARLYGGRGTQRGVVAVGARRKNGGVQGGGGVESEWNNLHNKHPQRHWPNHVISLLCPFASSTWAAVSDLNSSLITSLLVLLLLLLLLRRLLPSLAPVGLQILHALPSPVSDPPSSSTQSPSPSSSTPWPNCFRVCGHGVKAHLLLPSHKGIHIEEKKLSFYQPSFAAASPQTVVISIYWGMNFVCYYCVTI